MGCEGRAGAEPRLSPQNSTLTIEEFHAKLQEATNFPLRPFVIPFLKVGPSLDTAGASRFVLAKGGLRGGFWVRTRARVSSLHTQLLARVESHEAGAVCNNARGLAQLGTICNSLKIPFLKFAF